MRHENVNYFLVGAFVLGMLAVFTTVLVLVSPSVERDHYYVQYDQVLGLARGAPVSYQGYPVGKVDGIEPVKAPSGTRYRVRLAIERGWRIPSDSVARVVSQGLLSDITIDIAEGKSSEFLEPGAELQGQAGQDPLMALGDVANRMADLAGGDLGPLVERLNNTLDGVQSMLSEENSAHFAALLRNLDEASAHVNTLLAGLEGTRARFDQVLDESAGLLATTRPGMEQSVEDLRRSLEVVSQHVDAVVQDLELATRNLNEFSAQIRNNPSVLLTGRKAPPANLSRDGAP